MSTNGRFAQTAVILLEAPVSTAALRGALEGLAGLRELHEINPGAGAAAAWTGGNPGLTLAVLPDGNDAITLDVVAAQWPDALGTTGASGAGREAGNDAALLAAWKAGWMGPFTSPGSLARARVFAHFREEAAKLVEAHHAFVRVSVGAAQAAGGEGAAQAAERDALRDLQLVTAVASAVLGIPEALAYFNPAGDVLHSAATFDEVRDYHEGLGVLPYPLWAAVRTLRIEEAAPWLALDTVGLAQLDQVDHEACFLEGTFERREIAAFLRAATEHARQSARPVSSGDTLKGPGDIEWRVVEARKSLGPSQRAVLRWFPCDGSSPPPALLAGGKGA
jgi:hypothetical protein